MGSFNVVWCQGYHNFIEKGKEMWKLVKFLLDEGEILIFECCIYGSFVVILFDWLENAGKNYFELGIRAL